MQRRNLALSTVLCVALPLAVSLPESTKDVGTQLRELGYEPELDEDGDWRLLLGFDDGRSQIVWVLNSVNELGNADVREVFATAHVLQPEDDEERLSTQLLTDASSFILGSWARYEDNIYAVARIPADADEDLLEAAIQEVAGAADVLEEELTGDADAY